MERETKKDKGVCGDLDESFDWFLRISKVSNGYILTSTDMQEVIEDDDKDELKSGEELLWKVMEYFNFYGSKHDPERLRVIREKQ
jgi:hypothetical protein